MRLSKVIVLFSLLLAFAGLAWADTTASPEQLLPRNPGKFRLVRTVVESASPEPAGNPDRVSVPQATQIGEYAGNNGARATVEIVRFKQDAEAYELLSIVASQSSTSEGRAQLSPNVGTAGFVSPTEAAFFKGQHFVHIKDGKGTNETILGELAQSISEGLDKGEGEIPVLIKHLPEPEQAQKNAVFLNSFTDLDRLQLLPPHHHQVLNAIESGGNADAALATYDRGKVLVIEFNTPQLAADNDRRIIARIQELWNLGQPAPSAYRRVGNYSVFVFDAPDEQTAKQLIDQVHYEQVVQWLGENPNILKEAQKQYINTTLGVLVAVLKASGYALVACLGLGGLIGGLLFSYRRSQQKAVTAYSDAGGMLRLNLDDLTAETDPSRLLRKRK